MSTYRKPFFLVTIIVGLVLLFLIAPGFAQLMRGSPSGSARAQQQCEQLTSPDQLPSPVLINFDDLPNAAVIGNHYAPTFGVSFEVSAANRAIIYGNEPTEAQSEPNVAINNAVFPNTSSGVPMEINFDAPKSHVGYYIGNGETQRIAGLMTAFDASGGIICQVRLLPVPEPQTQFLGLHDPEGRIMRVTLDYGQTLLSESIDDLYFAPARGLPPTRTPMPTWTPVPTASPTPGPTATPTAVVPMIPYQPVAQVVWHNFFTPDLSIHGIEITQGIQCFDNSNGLGSCTDNSLPVVNKKDSTSRIYLKTSGLLSSVNNVPVRLYIRANGVWYQGNASGKATQTLDQTQSDSADIYFNVNFTNDVVVDFYAVVDPDNTITETNESNNRYPSSGYITLTFRRRDNLKIVGSRLYYHPSGYAGDQYAGGWAVNGGAANWFEQLLPIRNNGINYSVRSGYLNWTKSLGSSSNQHDLIKTLNAYWILENVFSWLFSGAFTGADHVYGWAPNAGYSGGHADMPVYPHAGGLGIVGIGTDRTGTSTDNPGGGALIFGHELVHDYDVFHTNTADACGSNDSNSDFPYATSGIQEVGFNPITGKIYDPANTHDVMSYCPAGGSRLGWIAPFTWNRMFNNFSSAASIYRFEGATLVEKAELEKSYIPNTFLPSTLAESLVVDVTIFNPDYETEIAGALGEMHQVSTGLLYYPPTGDYSVQLRDGQGEVLFELPFAADFESEYDAHDGGNDSPEDEPPFPPEPTDYADLSFIIPWSDATSSVVLTYLGEPIDERVVSDNPPQVLITNPTGQEQWAPGSTHRIEWQAIDLDGDLMTYSVFYSAEGGGFWILLQSELTETFYDVAVDSMAGGSDVRFRVVATDGVHIGVDETDQAITIPNQAPHVTILNPLPGSNFKPGELVVLQGSGTDFEDGTLPDESLVWSSDQQGGLGVGPSVPLSVLEPGTHVITLAEKDSFGVETSLSVSITIAYPSYLPMQIR